MIYPHHGSVRSLTATQCSVGEEGFARFVGSVWFFAMGMGMGGWWRFMFGFGIASSFTLQAGGARFGLGFGWGSLYLNGLKI